MAEKNLIPFNKLTVEQQRIVANNVGKRSGKVRQKIY